MNGRLYDPYLQRFLSPDPFVQSPMNPQNYNRYSYVLNNPLMYTDPSGYFHGSPEERQASRAAILQWRNAWMNVVEPPGGSGNSNLPFGYHGSFRESQDIAKNWQSIDNQFNNNSQPDLIDWLSGVMIPGDYDLIVTDGHFIFKHESGKHIIDITNYFVQVGKSGNNSRDIAAEQGGNGFGIAYDIIGGVGIVNGLVGFDAAINSNHVYRYAQRINGRRVSAAKLTATNQAKALKVLNASKSIGNKLGVAGGLVIAGDVLYNSEVNASHAINAVMTGIAFTGWGAPVAGIWFVADLGTWLITGTSISDRIDSGVGAPLVDWDW